MLDHARYLGSLRTDSAGLLAAARAAGPAAPVPACPGWTTDDLVWHIGEVHDFWGRIVAERWTDLGSYQEPPRPDGREALLRFAETTASRLADALDNVDPATPVWTWAPRQDVAFVSRRIAQETAVHRVDAEQAAGGDHRIDPELAADGIDEFLEHFIARVAGGAPPLDGSVHLHCTDVAGEWLARTDADDQYVVTRQHAKGDAAVRGPAHDLLMVLWRRQPLDTVEVIGDRAVAERLVARTLLG